jgi:hypothetical protein
VHLKVTIIIITIIATIIVEHRRFTVLGLVYQSLTLFKSVFCLIDLA